MPAGSALRFEIQAEDTNTQARCGVVHTAHGTFETPAFFPVATQATVKGILPELVRSVGTQGLLVNSYHLALRPGAEVVAAQGGLHRFMSWPHPLITDSGGFQVFSLGSLVRVSDDAVLFRSHLDGTLIEWSPEHAVRTQQQLGADIIMALDECPPANAPRDVIATAVRRTTAWARRSKHAHRRDDQAIFGIVQGGIYPDLRERSAREITELDFPGYAIGGLSVGESHDEMVQMLDVTAPLLPHERLRYLMGVGEPRDVLEAVARGVDLFDCVLPTRNGRNGQAWTWGGVVRIRNSEHRCSELPLDPTCDCTVCRRFSRAYLRHLFMAGEMLGPILLSLHNLRFFAVFMARIREAIRRGTFARFHQSMTASPLLSKA